MRRMKMKAKVRAMLTHNRKCIITSNEHTKQYFFLVHRYVFVCKQANYSFDFFHLFLFFLIFFFPSPSRK